MFFAVATTNELVMKLRYAAREWHILSTPLATVLALVAEFVRLLQAAAVTLSPMSAPCLAHEPTRSTTMMFFREFWRSRTSLVGALPRLAACAARTAVSRQPSMPTGKTQAFTTMPTTQYARASAAA